MYVYIYSESIAPESAAPLLEKAERESFRELSAVPPGESCESLTLGKREMIAQRGGGRREGVTCCDCDYGFSEVECSSVGLFGGY